MCGFLFCSPLYYTCVTEEFMKRKSAAMAMTTTSSSTTAQANTKFLFYYISFLLFFPFLVFFNFYSIFLSTHIYIDIFLISSFNATRTFIYFLFFARMKQNWLNAGKIQRSSQCFSIMSWRDAIRLDAVTANILLCRFLLKIYAFHPQKWAGERNKVRNVKR